MGLFYQRIKNNRDRPNRIDRKGDDGYGPYYILKIVAGFIFQDRPHYNNDSNSDQTDPHQDQTVMSLFFETNQDI